MGRNIPSVEVNNYAAIFTKPIFKNQTGEWYRDVGYEDSLDLIRENFVGARKSFIAIGYYLKHMKENKLYIEGGYKDIWECAYKEFNLSQPSATKYMQLNTLYSVDGNSPLLDERYMDFSISQLQEMFALPDEKREEIKPEQTVSEIRKIAKEEKQLSEPSENEIKKFYESCVKDMDDKSRSTLKERLKKRYRNARGYYGIVEYKGSPRGLTINKRNEITWANVVRLIDRYIPQNKHEDKEQPETEKQETAGEEQQLPGQMKVEDYPGVVPEQPKLPEGHVLEKTRVMVDTEEIELPFLKNNEQRKSWIEDYKAWGLWYRDENIDINYYKYEFPDGSRLIAAEYPQRENYWIEEKTDEVYYHLLEKKKEKYDRTTYDEKFRNDTNSITDILEFLIKIQKGVKRQ